MHITRRNVNEAFTDLVGMIHNEQIPVVRRPSRVGEVLMIDEPVLVTYTHPWERVLLNEARDCNPFFHLYESLWMLAGMNDAASLEMFTSKMSQFSDDGETLHGAYGHRWREYLECPAKYDDQLAYVVRLLKQDPTTRRAVLSMWSPKQDLVPQCEKEVEWLDYCPGKDYPCNTHAYFAVNHGKLELTICNRSNDLVLGMTGANAVHMSFLLEYVSGQTNIPMGKYYQFTNNLHVYTSNWDPDLWLKSADDSRYSYEHEQIRHHQIAKRPDFDNECGEIVANPFDYKIVANPFDYEQVKLQEAEYQDNFLQYTAMPMFRAFRCHKERCYSLVHYWLGKIQSKDWQLAARSWIRKREEAWRDRAYAEASSNEG